MLDTAALETQLRTQTTLKVVYGSCALYRGPEADAEHTHRWCLFIRADSDPDLDLLQLLKDAEQGKMPSPSPPASSALYKYFERIEIALHESFEPPVRVLEHPPYFVSEVGWGSFDTLFRLYPRDSSIAPVEITVPLILHTRSAVLDDRPVLSFFCDLLVLSQPKRPRVNKRKLGDDTPIQQDGEQVNGAAASDSTSVRDPDVDVDMKTSAGRARKMPRFDECEERDHRVLQHMLSCVRRSIETMYDQSLLLDDIQRGPQT